jgi:Mg/Co/Ni transporter MgtE
MNDWDKDNLNFLMKISPELLKDFLQVMDADDVAYAMELLRTAKAEILVESMEYEESYNQHDEEFPEASAVLNKFTLKG